MFTIADENNNLSLNTTKSAPTNNGRDNITSANQESATAKIVERSKVLSQTPYDSSLMEDAINVLLNSGTSSSPYCSFDPTHEPPILRIISICSSSDTAYKYVIPKLLAYYHSKREPGQDIYAQITHIIPPHKKSFMINNMDNYMNNSHKHETNESDTDSSASYYHRYQELQKQQQSAQLSRSRSLYSTFRVKWPASPYNTNGNNSNGGGYFSNINHGTASPPISPTLTDDSTAFTRNRSSTSSTNSSIMLSDNEDDEPFVRQQHSENDIEILNNYYENKIYNNFALTPNNITVVPPYSIHYTLNIHPLPTHVLPSFDSLVNTRLIELTIGGIMIICYPTSRKLYDDHVLPCLDLALHQLLALNMISTTACEHISKPPNKNMIPSFDDQLKILQNIDNTEILYSSEINKYTCWDWGYRWLNEEIEWMKASLADSSIYSSQMLVSIIDGMSKSKQWSAPGLCDVGIFVIRKKK